MSVMEITLHSFFTSVIDGGTWTGLRPGRYTLEKHSSVPTKAVRKVSSHFEYLENLSHTLDVTWQQSEEILLCIREQSLSRGASQSAVRRR